MVDIENLKALANEAIADECWEPLLGLTSSETAFAKEASPVAVLELIAEVERLEVERDQLRAEVEALRKGAERYRQAMVEVMRQVDGNIRETVRDCVNGGHDVQDIYDYCDLIEEAIGAAMAAKEGE